MSALLQVDKISKRFGGFAALSEVSFDLNDGERFGINIIPYTLTHTTWGDRQPGDLVNIEADLLARYAARLAETEDTAQPEDKKS